MLQRHAHPEDRMRSRTSPQPDTAGNLHGLDDADVLVELDADMKRRGWVSLAERLRCTYLTREELPRADAERAEVTRLSAASA
jgi:hypothetical protein